MKRAVGDRFGRLVITASAERKSRNVYWICQCDCGVTCTKADRHLVSGKSQSCGCLQKELARARRLTHGRTRTSIYRIHAGMMKRCYTPTDPAFPDYGGRGIKVCERWHSFANFLADMGERPPGKTLDRINNDGDYEPLNCRWATRAEQSRNKRSNVHVTLHGRTMCLTDWASELGLNKNSVSRRLYAGWSPERALLTPIAKEKRNRRAKVLQHGDEIRSGQAVEVRPQA